MTALVYARHCFSILAVCIVSALITEAISWALIYRHPEYKKSAAAAARLAVKVDALRKESSLVKEKKSRDKKVSAGVGVSIGVLARLAAVIRPPSS